MLRWRYGLLDGREHTLTEVGERYGIGRDRARRIERDALARLRKMATAARLTSLSDGPSPTHLGRWRVGGG
ncbi:sigma factor-like helix-turn-helix DNA-binding protein, partial [Nonomuraea rubra]|uniref:sigma factor-like helix-turn-helix DNA-binding protein n=1 Tax=Nonomuraea rubra TaxID=46180 RepID=UPI0031E899F9